MAEEKKLVTKLREQKDRAQMRLARIGEALEEAGSPANVALFDIGGAVAGIATTWGLDWSVRKVANEKDPEPTWKTALTKAAVGTGAYALSLAVPYDMPMNPLRRGISSASLVVMAFGVDATAKKAMAALRQGREKQMQQALQQAAAFERARLEAAAQAAKK